MFERGRSCGEPWSSASQCFSNCEMYIQPKFYFLLSVLLCVWQSCRDAELSSGICLDVFFNQGVNCTEFNLI